MSDSKVAKEVFEILEAADEHIEVAAEMSGLLTEYMKKVNEKVPLSDLLMEIGKFLKSEVVPALEAVEAELFRQRKNTAKGWLEVYEVAYKQSAGMGSGPEMAKEIVLQMMRSSTATMQNMSHNLSQTSKKK